MAIDYVRLSALFDPGAENIEEALAIYEHMRDIWNDCLGIWVNEVDEKLWVRDKGDGRGAVISHALLYVAECASTFKLTGTWSAPWLNESFGGRFDAHGGGVVSLDLNSRAKTSITSEAMRSINQNNLEEVATRKKTFPFEVVLGHGMPRPTDWLKEYVGGNWLCYTRVVSAYELSRADEEVYQFKSENHAMLFRLRFGGVALQ